MHHVKSIKIKTIGPAISASPPSILNCSTMENIPPMREKAKHLSDVDIGKILGLAKAARPQPKLLPLWSALRIQSNTCLQPTYSKPFKDATHGKNTNGKQQNRKITTSYMSWSRIMMFLSVILPIKSPLVFLQQHFIVGAQKQDWKVILQWRNQIYHLRIFTSD